MRHVLEFRRQFIRLVQHDEGIAMTRKETETVILELISKDRAEVEKKEPSTRKKGRPITDMLPAAANLESARY